MNMCGGCCTRYRLPESQKGNTGVSQIINQRLSFRAVRMQRHINGIAVVKSQLIVNFGLSEGANRQRVIERGNEISADFCNIGDYPCHAPVVTNERISGNVHPAAQGSFRQLLSGGDFSSSIVCRFDLAIYLPASGGEFSTRGSQFSFHFLHFFPRDDALIEQLLLGLQFLA